MTIILHGTNVTLMTISIDGINYLIKSSKTVYIGTGKSVDVDVQGDGVNDSSLIGPNLTIKSMIIYNNRKYAVKGLNNCAFACSNWLTSVMIPRSINLSVRLVSGDAAT